MVIANFDASGAVKEKIILSRNAIEMARARQARLKTMQSTHKNDSRGTPFSTVTDDSLTHVHL